MASDEQERLLIEIKGKSSQQLKLDLVNMVYLFPISELVRDELEKRKEEKIEKQFKEMLGATQDNANSTKKLVWATWGLVAVTAFLVLLTYFEMK